MNGTVTVVDSVFLDNWSSLAGGAIRARGSTLSVARCTFERNQALTQGGGAVACQGSNCTLSSCSFKDHVTSGNGGVLLANNDAFRVVMQDCELTNSRCALWSALYLGWVFPKCIAAQPSILLPESRSQVSCCTAKYLAAQPVFASWWRSEGHAQSYCAGAKLSQAVCSRCLHKSTLQPVLCHAHLC